MTTTISADNGSISGSAGLKSTPDGSGVLALQTGANVTALTIDASQNIAVNSGNFSFSSTGQKITGDFTNATLLNRTTFQTSTTNGSTGAYFLPNGTSTAASVQAANNADPTNASKILIATNGSTDVQLVSGINGTGTYLPLTFYNGGSERARIDTSGYMYSQPNSAGQGLVPGMMTYILNADNNLNGTLLTLQNPFGAATPTLQPGRYRYRLAMSFVKNTGTGQATYAMGGTATISYAAHNIYTRAGATFQTTASPVFQFITTTTPTVSVAITGNTTAVAQDTIVSDGYIDVSVAGTVFFGVGFSSAPGTATAGSYRFVQGSYVEIWPVSATGANTNIGGWA